MRTAWCNTDHSRRLARRRSVRSGSRVRSCCGWGVAVPDSVDMGYGISGILQGAGGVGGLLYLTVDGEPYIPCYDNNGNIIRYLAMPTEIPSRSTLTMCLARSLGSLARSQISSAIVSPQNTLILKVACITMTIGSIPRR